MQFTAASAAEAASQVSSGLSTTIKFPRKHQKKPSIVAVEPSACPKVTRG